MYDIVGVVFLLKFLSSADDDQLSIDRREKKDTDVVDRHVNK